MEDDLYGLSSASAVQAEYMSFEEFDDDRVQMAFGSDPIFPPAGSSSALSDAASMAAAEAQRGGGGSFADKVSGGVREKIASHPLYPKLLEAYIDCRKVGAPPEIANELEEIRRESDQLINRRRTAVFGFDPELDNFMETYCDILVRYKSDLSRPFDEATTFLNEMQSQLNSLGNKPTTTASTSYVSGL